MGCRMAQSIPYPSIHSLTFSPLLTQLQTSYTYICSEAQQWGEAQCDAQYLYPQACLVDQGYHGILGPNYSI